MEQVSVFEIFKIGLGPSSSHTMGPLSACRSRLEEVQSDGCLDRVTRVQVTLYGSLAKTGIGHGTNRAVMLGLMGDDPATVDVSQIQNRLDRIRASKEIALLGSHTIAFDPYVDIVARHQERKPFHSNALDITIEMVDGRLSTETYYSVGGGFVVREGEHVRESDATAPHAVTDGAELMASCRRAGCTVSELVRENERSRRSDSEIDMRLTAIWETMKDGIYRGCHTYGKLPGGLDVERRAPRLAARLLDGSAYNGIGEWIDTIRTRGRDFHDVSKWVSCFAIATNEENAAFGRVVTAPTNGAAGVVPAVMLYHICFDGGSDEDAIRFLLTAGQIGMLFKHGATLSAAMGGCQAEIGVSSAMASAALTELNGGSLEQVLMAAEIAMEHHLGLTCDPVGGLVQIPCIERNSMGAIKAITASNIALESDPAHAKVSLDAVIRSMWDTARDMNDKYKETSEGGLASHIPVSVIEC